MQVNIEIPITGKYIVSIVFGLVNNIFMLHRISLRSA